MKKIDRAAAAYRKSGFLKTSTEDTEKELPVNKVQKTSSIHPPTPRKAPATEPVQAPVKGSGYSKAAKFLLLIGPDQAAEVLKQFSSEDIEKIVKEIAQVRKLDRKESSEILKDFSGVRPSRMKDWNLQCDGSVTGGPDRAREMLFSAFGKEKGSAVFNKVLPFGGRKPFDFFDELHPEQILVVLKNEPPYVLSTVLSFLEPKLSAKILSEMPAKSRQEIVMRIARQGEVAPGVIEKMEAVFRDRIRTQGEIITEEIDGKSVLADILKHMDLRAEEKILENITESNRALAEEIKDSIYTIDMILRMDDKDVQYLLRDFADSELAVIIKGKPDNIRDRILGSISERRRLIVEEESLHLGEMLRSDVDKSTREMVEYLRELEQKGTVVIPRGEEKWI